jgi:hypothetical protein
VIYTTVNDLFVRFSDLLSSVMGEGSGGVGYSGERRMFWGWSMWDMGRGAGLWR